MEHLTYEIGRQSCMTSHGNLHKNWKNFDVSNYLKNSNFYDETNKIVIKKVNNEVEGVAIVKFVGLKPKIVELWHMSIKL